MNVPGDLLYAESHEWLRIEGGVGTVGITDHAQHELTDVVYVEPPKVGAVLKAKNPVAVVESVKAASDIYAPVSGEVVETNGALSADPALVNTDPYGKGWLFKIKLSDEAEKAKLKSPEAYQAQIGG
jgi:glycine cleavage system H protein